ncbi:MAG: VOC family protein [Armatimonadota bacterium]
MPRPVWFEIPADDMQRAIKFYADAFGWRISKMEWTMEYWVIETPGGPGTCMGGAIMPRAAGACTRNTIDVPSLDECFEKIRGAGGRVVSDKMPIPSGMFAVCVDTEGNEFGVMELSPGNMPEIRQVQANGVLGVTHFDLPADDVARAIGFYETVFGWQISKWEGPMDYWMVSTGPASELGMDGGLLARQEGACNANTVKVPDADEYAGKVEAAGGSITMDKHELPGVGWYVMCEDTEGNGFGLLQPL